VLDTIDAMLTAAEKHRLSQKVAAAVATGEWTPTEKETPPANQIVRAILEHYTDDEELDMQSVHLAIGKDEHSVKMLSHKFINKHPLHKVAMWQPVNLLDRDVQLEAIAFLTELALKGE